jgi:endogenous inhibitor of DNA gyrase (YacG/DUF329 family)
MSKKKKVKCKNCGKEFEVYLNNSKSFCSKECYIKYRNIKKKCKNCGKEFIVGRKSKKIYCCNKCASEDLKEVRSKSIKETFSKKYGVNSPSQLKSVKNKIKKLRDNGVYDNIAINIKKTKLEKYGDENYNNINQNKKTKLEKYGDENYNNRDKFKKTMKTKYERGIHPNTEKKLYESLRLKRIGFESEKFQQFLRDNNVFNTSQLQFVKDKILIKRRIVDFNNLYIKNKFKRSEPLFDVNDYISQNKNQLYKFKCLKCNKIFKDHIHQNHIPSCPECYSIKFGTSIVEEEVISFIKKILPNIKIITKDRSILNKKELDVYIPEKDVAIEINGLYWHSEISGKKNKNYHLNKTNECNDKNIQLIHIFDIEWIMQKEIVMSRLKSILKANSNMQRIYARHCEVKEINSKIKNNFLNKYHLQGSDKSKYKLGLFYKSKLISVMTFNNLRIALGNKNKNNNVFELGRFVSDNSISVIGGASKLLSYFIKNYNPKKIITYADKRWSQGNLYKKIGFARVSDTPPNYWYIGPTRYDLMPKHRFNFRKNVLNEKLDKFDESLTEWQNMQINGYDRVWDCGSIKYEMIINKEEY